jgi:hypothetical protein
LQQNIIKYLDERCGTQRQRIIILVTTEKYLLDLFEKILPTELVKWRLISNIIMGKE